MAEEIEYNGEFQELIISMMLTNPDLFARSNDIIKPEYFKDSFKPVVEFMKEYSTEYNSLPTLEQIKVKTGKRIEKLTEYSELHDRWYFDTIEQFCRHRAIELAIIKSPDLIEKGQYNEVESIIKEAVLVSLQRDIGVNYWEDPAKRLRDLKNNNGTIKTGLTILDQKLYGGMGRGELHYFVAPSNGGKSVLLQNVTLNFALAGLNVAYITLEMSAELCAKRLDSMVTDIPNSEIYRNLNDVDFKVKLKGKSAGLIQFKKLPEGGTTVNNLKAYVRELEIRTGKKLDVLVVDYADLLYPNKKIDISNLSLKDKLISEELRGYASEHQMLVVTASQLNRSAQDESEYNQSMIAGGLTKFMTADGVYGIYNTLSMRERGQIQIQIMKTRNSGGVGSKLDFGYNIETLRVFDLDIPTDKNKITLKQKIDDAKNKSQPSPQVSNTTSPQVPSASVNSDKLKELLAKARGTK